MSGDPSWEDCVNAILIPGDPGAIDDAGFRWQNIFTALGDVKHVLDYYVLQEQGWSGPAAEAYKNVVGSICRQIQEFIDSNSYINSKLFQASYDLKNAMVNMPIPESMVPMILQKRQEFETKDSYWPVPRDAFLNDAITQAQQQNTNDPNLHFGPDSWAAAFDDWLNDNTGQAVAIYKDLDNRHGDTAATMPNGVSGVNPLGDNFTVPDLSHPGGGGGFGGANFGGGPKAPTTLDPNTFNPGTDSLDPSNTDPMTGLSGVDGSQFTGAGGGGGGGAYPGLGRTTGLGAGGGGAGAGGLSPAAAAAAMKGIGTPVAATTGAGMGMTPGMMGGMGGGAKAPSSRRPGLVGAGGPGAGGRGADDAHGTWLQEDDDVWGTDSGAAPPLLT